MTPKANEYLMHWLVSRELYISYYISRHFTWFRNVYWPEHLPKKHHVMISTADCLIDGSRVCQYLSDHDISLSVFPIGKVLLPFSIIIIIFFFFFFFFGVLMHYM